MPSVTKPMMRRADRAHHFRAEMGGWIRAHREARELTQRELGELIGVTTSAISAFETGHSSVPPDRYMALAEALQIKPAIFALTALRYSNPWAFAMIAYADPRPALERLAAELPERLGKRMNEPEAE